MNPAEPLLSIDDLTIDVGPVSASTRLVDAFGLTIEAGQRVALVGESGSGKSLVARSVMRLATGVQVSGSVHFRGEDLLRLPVRRMRALRGRQIAMVFQDPLSALNPLMTVGAQVAEPLRRAGVARRSAEARAATVMTDLGIADAVRRMSAYPHEFSGGMRQRVALAIALVGEPSLLIADEPTTALDVRVQQQVLDLLDRVAADRSLAVLLITHDLAAVAGFCQRVVVMYAGRKVHEDDVDPLFNAPAHPYTAALLQAVPRLDGRGERLRPIPGAPPHPTDRSLGCAFNPRCAHQTQACTAEIPALRRVTDSGTVACHHPLVISEVAR